MARPAVSIIVPTFRLGGLDVLYHGLMAQDFQDFEVILVDALQPRRAAVVEERTDGMPFRTRHVEPFNNPFPVNSFQRFANTGISLAEGERILFLGDYAWMSPGTVGAHAAFHEASPSSSMVAPMEFLRLPETASGFVPWYNLNVESSYPASMPKPDVARLIGEYVAEIGSGSQDRFMWSIFEHEFDGPDGLGPCDIMHGADVAIRTSPGPCHHNLFHFQNDSVPREAALRINGCDEAFDGSNGWQDTEFAERLSGQFVCNPYHVTYCINARFVFPRCEFLRTSESNRLMWLDRKAASYPGVVNSWSLREGWKK
jgi:glycosyltransferase involved in cell wall biosynthesis